MAGHYLPCLHVSSACTLPAHTYNLFVCAHVLCAASFMACLVSHMYFSFCYFPTMPPFCFAGKDRKLVLPMIGHVPVQAGYCPFLLLVSNLPCPSLRNTRQHAAHPTRTLFAHAHPHHFQLHLCLLLGRDGFKPPPACWPVTTKLILLFASLVYPTSVSLYPKPLGRTCWDRTSFYYVWLRSACICMVLPYLSCVPSSLHSLMHGGVPLILGSFLYLCAILFKPIFALTSTPACVSPAPPKTFSVLANSQDGNGHFYFRTYSHGAHACLPQHAHAPCCFYTHTHHFSHA